MLRDKHREDLKEAQQQTIAAMRDTILVQADMIDYLRAKLEGHGYVPQRTTAINPASQPSADRTPGDPESPKKWLSEEEEELLALNLNGHLSDLELASLQQELGLPGLTSVPSLPDDE